jgi:serine/threonine protein kinase
VCKSVCSVNRLAIITSYFFFCGNNHFILLFLGRDIKGANIVVGPNGEVKLADFGMAKHVCNFCFCSSISYFLYSSIVLISLVRP